MNENEDFLDSEEEIKLLQSRYGEMNPKGIMYLRENFDTHKAKQASHLLMEASAQLDSLSDEAEQIYFALRDIVDDDTYLSKKYDIEEHGNLGWHAGDLRRSLSRLEDKLEAARILLAPLERLIPITDDLDIDDDMIVAYDEKFKLKIF